MFPGVRRELKYLLPVPAVDRLREQIANICVLDEHCRGRPRQRYEIDSLYLDGPGLPFYRAKVDRAYRRLKLRVRNYDERWDGGFLEVKRKIDDVVHKTRARFVGDWRDALLSPGSEAAHDFASVRALTGAEPAVWVRYEREAWSSLVDDYARVTFDYSIRFQPAEPDVPRPDESRWRPIDDGYTEKTVGSCVVVELKFERLAPAWMGSLVRRLDLTRRGYSKYCAAVDQVWGRTRPLERLARPSVVG